MLHTVILLGVLNFLIQTAHAHGPVRSIRCVGSASAPLSVVINFQNRFRTMGHILQESTTRDAQADNKRISFPIRDMVCDFQPQDVVVLRCDGKDYETLSIYNNLRFNDKRQTVVEVKSLGKRHMFAFDGKLLDQPPRVPESRCWLE